MELTDLVVPTKRLELTLLGRAFLSTVVTGQSTPNLGFSDPTGFLVGAEDVVRLRLSQVEASPLIGPWLLRAIVVRDQGIAVGFIGFHAAPDSRGMVEIGYEVLPAFRRRGYASEAATAMIAWARQQGARIVRACVQPDNVASLAMIVRDGFALVGEQLDEIDGRELVFEKVLAS